MPTNFYMRRRRKDSFRFWTVIKKQAIEFCLATGLHGYKYIGQTERSKTERVIWTIIVFTSLCCAIVLMNKAWSYYASRPTFTVIESTHHGIWNYPFPAVTICNINRISLKLITQLVNNLKIPRNMTRQYLLNEMRLLLELIEPGIFEYNVKSNLTVLQGVLDANGLSINDVMVRVSRNCSSLIKTCLWNGVLVDCDSIFELSLSREGVCCSFNYVSNNSTLATKNSKLKRLNACGYQTGLMTQVNLDPSDYYATLFGGYGVKVMIHYPFDYPDYNAQNKFVGLGTQTFLSVSPEKTYSTNEVKDLSIEMRGCIFAKEKHTLEIYDDPSSRNFSFTQYSYLNCMAECRATVIKDKCNCIPFYYPQNSTRVCNLRDVECLLKYKFWYDTSRPGTDMSLRIESTSPLEKMERPCGCMPDCDLYRYPIESSQGLLNKNIYFANESFTMDSKVGQTLDNNSIVHVFFSDLVAIQYRRAVQYNWRNLFASFGGLLGLFSGFSLMSGFELIYFFVVRVVTDACTKRRT